MLIFLKLLAALFPLLADYCSGMLTFKLWSCQCPNHQPRRPATQIRVPTPTWNVVSWPVFIQLCFWGKYIHCISVYDLSSLQGTSKLAPMVGLLPYNLWNRIIFHWTCGLAVSACLHCSGFWFAEMGTLYVFVTSYTPMLPPLSTALLPMLWCDCCADLSLLGSTGSHQIRSHFFLFPTSSPLDWPLVTESKCFHSNIQIFAFGHCLTWWRWLESWKKGCNGACEYSKVLSLFDYFVWLPCVCRHIGALSAVLRGRTHLSFKIFQGRQHHVVFTYALSLLDSARPFAFHESLHGHLLAIVTAFSELLQVRQLHFSVLMSLAFSQGTPLQFLVIDELASREDIHNLHLSAGNYLPPLFC